MTVEYGQQHAEVYDLVFEGRGKDFEGEAQRLTELVRARHADADSLLDVACGTGAHLKILAKLFGHVEGVEMAPAMQKLAEERLPGVVVHEADMRTFDLGRRFDAVICVGNSVACLDSTKDLNAAVARMAAHLEPTGVLVMEPWFFSADFLDGRVDGHLHRQDGRVVSQLTRFAKEGGRIRMDARFVVADATGFHQFDETLSARAFPRAAYTEALREAGLDAAFVRGFTWADGRPTAPGLFVGTRRA
jgi:SAM-dependent methyltransferase